MRRGRLGQAGDTPREIRDDHANSSAKHCRQSCRAEGAGFCDDGAFYVRQRKVAWFGGRAVRRWLDVQPFTDKTNAGAGGGDDEGGHGGVES